MDDECIPEAERKAMEDRLQDAIVNLTFGKIFDGVRLLSGCSPYNGGQGCYEPTLPVSDALENFVNGQMFGLPVNDCLDETDFASWIFNKQALPCDVRYPFGEAQICFFDNEIYGTEALYVGDGFDIGTLRERVEEWEDSLFTSLSAKAGRLDLFRQQQDWWWEQVSKGALTDASYTYNTEGFLLRREPAFKGSNDRDDTLLRLKWSGV